MSYGRPESPRPQNTNPYASASPQSPFKPGGNVNPRSPKNGWLGISSIACAILAGIVELGGVIVATVAVMNSGQAEPNPESPELMLAGCGIIAGIGIALLAMVLGLVGVVLPNSNKVTSGIGIGLAAVVVIAICGLMAIGMAS